MVRNLYFTEDQLEKLKRKDLYRIAAYYKLEGITKRITKKELLERLKSYFGLVEVEETDEDFPVSVRVRRIKESVA